MTGFTGAEPVENDAGFDPLVVARTALLVHIMDADGKTLPEERATLLRVLAEAYHLDEDGAARLIKAGERADHGATDLYQHTSLLRRSTSEQEREELVRLLFEIAYADQELHEGEDALVKRIADLLGVDPRARVLARREVASDRGASHIAKRD